MEEQENWIRDILVVSMMSAETPSGASGDTSLGNANPSTVTKYTHQSTCYGRQFYAKVVGRQSAPDQCDKPVFVESDIRRKGYLFKRGTWFKSW